MEMHFPERILHFCDRADPRVATNIHHDSDGIRNDLAERGIEPVIPPRSNRKTPIEYDREVYKRRNLIERCVNRLKQFRRIATRYEKNGQSLSFYANASQPRHSGSKPSTRPSSAPN